MNEQWASKYTNFLRWETGLFWALQDLVWHKIYSIYSFRVGTGLVKGSNRDLLYGRCSLEGIHETAKRRKTRHHYLLVVDRTTLLQRSRRTAKYVS